MSPGDALRALHARGAIAKPWAPGMLYRRVDGPRMPARLDEHGGDVATMPGWAPDLADPATRGAVLALIREATGDPGVHVLPLWAAGSRTPSRWVAVGYPGELDYPQPTEEGAYAHLLEAIASAQDEVAP